MHVKKLEESINMNLEIAKYNGDFPSPFMMWYGKPTEIFNGRTWVKNGPDGNKILRKCRK